MSVVVPTSPLFQSGYSNGDQSAAAVSCRDGVLLDQLKG